MEKLKILVATPIDEESLGKIIAVSDRISVEPISKLIVAEKKGDPAAKAKLDPLLSEAEVLFGLIHHLPRNTSPRMPKLKWLQVMSAGIDRLDEGILRRPVIVTNVSGIHAVAMGEFALHLMLSFAKHSVSWFRQQQEKQWKRFYANLLHSQTVGILGLGSIGREIARLSKAFGMRVLATRRSAKEGERARNVDFVFPPEQLTKLLSASDFLTLALPLTAETTRLIGEAELRAMKPTAYLINIARGEIVDESALIRALEEKWIAGAGLDVFATEPLPPDSKIWSLPNVIYSPHIAGYMPDYDLRATEVFCENLRRYLQGKKFLHVVDKKKGY
jgi:phosphoglycerate dehydrogenase-like enzyme